MGLGIDLHSHSNMSDGVLSPADLVQHAAAVGVEVLALTDHDSTAGIRPAAVRARELGVVLVPGVEISVTWRTHLIHIVALGVDIDHPALVQGLAAQCGRREARAREIDARLQRLGIDGVYRTLQGAAAGQAIGRMHFARYLVEHGWARDHQKAFKRYLGRKGKCYVPVEWVDLETAVGWICAAGGVAVIAHPARYTLNRQALCELMVEFRRSGGAAVEVVSGSHPAASIAQMAELADRYDLLASVGSDFHAEGNGWAQLGRVPALPQGCEPVWDHVPLSTAVPGAWTRRDRSVV